MDGAAVSEVDSTGTGAQVYGSKRLASGDEGALASEVIAAWRATADGSTGGPAVSVTCVDAGPPLTGWHWPGATVAVTVMVAGVERVARHPGSAPSDDGAKGSVSGSANAIVAGTASATDMRAGTSSAVCSLIMWRTVRLSRAIAGAAARQIATVRNMNTPALLIRTALYALVGQILVITVIAIAVPSGPSLLTMTGFVTPYYETNVLGALHILAIPSTHPTVFMSVQSAAQMLALALVAAGLVGLIKSNPWEHGILPDSTPPGRDKSTVLPAGAGTPPGPLGPGATPVPMSPPAIDPPGQSAAPPA